MGFEHMSTKGKDPRFTIQPFLARMVFGNTVPENEAGMRWVTEGYAQKFRTYLEEHADFDVDPSDTEKLKEIIDTLRGTIH